MILLKLILFSIFICIPIGYSTILSEKISFSANSIVNSSITVSKRSAFFYKQNASDRHAVESKEHPAKNTTNSPLRPRFATPREVNFKMEPDQFMCREKYDPICQNKTKLFRKHVLEEFQKVYQESVEEYNIYNVTYMGQKNHPRTAVCSILKSAVRTLRRKDFTFIDDPIVAVIPRKKLFAGKQNRMIKSCAVVSSAGSLANSKLGKFIDMHDVVMRFNHAPVEGYESDVGTKTTIRVINSQVVTKPEFQFLDSSLFRNISIAAWDPGRYNGSLAEWLKQPDFDLFANFMDFMKRDPFADMHLIDPRSIWRLWETLQDNSKVRIRRNPPSSGFIGISLLMPVCEYIDVIEYIPSTRLNGRCHYYDEEINPTCTFGSWHPLAAEKLMALDMNSADDYAVYQSGIVRIRTPEKTNCQ